MYFIAAQHQGNQQSLVKANEFGDQLCLIANTLRTVLSSYLTWKPNQATASNYLHVHCAKFFFDEFTNLNHIHYYINTCPKNTQNLTTCKDLNASACF